MTHSDRDPAPDTPWQPVSSEWARRQAIEATAAAVRRARQRRETTPTPSNQAGRGNQ